MHALEAVHLTSHATVMIDVQNSKDLKEIVSVVKNESIAVVQRSDKNDSLRSQLQPILEMDDQLHNRHNNYLSSLKSIRDELLLTITEFDSNFSELNTQNVSAINIDDEKTGNARSLLHEPNADSFLLLHRIMKSHFLDLSDIRGSSKALAAETNDILTV